MGGTAPGVAASAGIELAAACDVVRARGERLPVGIEAFPGREPNDLVLWVESRRAIVAGDTFINGSAGLEFPFDERDEQRFGATREQTLDAVRTVLELPVELVLPTHGPPTDRAALDRALA